MVIGENVSVLAYDKSGAHAFLFLVCRRIALEETPERAVLSKRTARETWERKTHILHLLDDLDVDHSGANFSCKIAEIGRNHLDLVTSGYRHGRLLRRSSPPSTSHIQSKHGHCQHCGDKTGFKTLSFSMFFLLILKIVCVAFTRLR